MATTQQLPVPAAPDKGPDLPLFALAHGPWRAEVFDPRPNPSSLGLRYVHGGWISRLWRGDRCLTSRVRPAWNSNEGEGLPESFELALGFPRALEGEECLCIGAGRARHQGRGYGPMTAPVVWEVVERDARRLVMRCADTVTQDPHVTRYELTRTLALRDDGLDSVTTLRIDLLWSHPVQWYPHPFFAHTGPDRTAFQLPGGARAGKGPSNMAGPAVVDAGGVWRLPPQESLTNFVGLWGARGPIVVHLDPALGGGRMRVELDCPLDHLVVWANPYVASPEPKIIRAWKDGEELTWRLAYRWME